MKNAASLPTILLLSLFLSAISPVRPAMAEDWHRVSSADGKISALFPVDLKQDLQTQTDRTLAGKVKSFFGEYHGDGFMLAASGADIPRLARAAGSKAVYEGSRDLFIEQAQGTESSFKETTVKGVPAYELIYKGEAYQGKGDPYQGRALFVVVDKRMYIINAIVSKETEASKAASKKMFDSIQITE